jgi:hypothetical protein
MRDVEWRIDQWRCSMARQLGGRVEVLEELEDHLRDEMDRLTEEGHPPERAAEVALARLGRPGDIAAEFAKVPPPTAPWLPVRLMWAGGAILAVSMLRPLAPRFSAGGLDALLAAHMGAVMLGYVATLLVGFLAACFLLTRLFRDLSVGQAETLRRAVVKLAGAAVALTGLGMGLGIFCPYEKQGWFFGLDTREVGGFAILAWDIFMLACCALARRPSKLGTMMLLGIAGNVVVALGWLGAAAVERQLHGSPSNALPVIALVLGQLAIGGAALAPAGCLRGVHA